MIDDAEFNSLRSLTVGLLLGGIIVLVASAIAFWSGWAL